MVVPAPPVPGRRVSLGAAAVLAGFLLLAPPLYLLGPFALLTLFTRPRTARELFWLAAAATGVVAGLSGGVELVPQMVRTSGLLLTGVFVILSARSVGPVFPRALLAVALTAVGLAVWAAVSGLTWGEIERAFTEVLRGSDALRNAAGDPTSRQDVRDFVQQVMDRAPDLARIMPGLLALEALAGLLLAWSWHHRIASAPLGQPPARFRDFRFNDQLVWGAIFTLGLMLVPLPPIARVVASNFLLVWVGLYATRGLAIVAAISAGTAPPLKVFAALLALLLAPVALGSCVALGLADTWLNVRGRLLPPVSGGA
jgi:hypothetical protein